MPGAFSIHQPFALQPQELVPLVMSPKPQVRMEVQKVKVVVSCLPVDLGQGTPCGCGRSLCTY